MVHIMLFSLVWAYARLWVAFVSKIEWAAERDREISMEMVGELTWLEKPEGQKLQCGTS